MDAEKRHELTFAQAEGVEELPTQLAAGELSQSLRARLWALLHTSLQATRERTNRLGFPWSDILYSEFVLHQSGMADDFDSRLPFLIPKLRSTFEYGTYVDVLGFVQFIIREPDCPQPFKDAVAQTLVECCAAYRVVDGWTIVPMASEAEGQAVLAALEATEVGGFEGGRSHLLRAASALSAGDFSSSVRESIHAVEAVARKLEPKAKTLEPALRKLESRIKIHPALRTGFSNLYGYTSDEKGIRHSLMDISEATVDEADALYMFGACAAFVTYLISKAGRS